MIEFTIKDRRTGVETHVDIVPAGNDDSTYTVTIDDVPVVPSALAWIIGFGIRQGLVDAYAAPKDKPLTDEAARERYLTKKAKMLAGEIRAGGRRGEWSGDEVAVIKAAVVKAGIAKASAVKGDTADEHVAMLAAFHKTTVEAMTARIEATVAKMAAARDIDIPLPAVKTAGA